MPVHNRASCASFVWSGGHVRVISSGDEGVGSDSVERVVAAAAAAAVVCIIRSRCASVDRTGSAKPLHTRDAGQTAHDGGCCVDIRSNSE
eukprot:6193099-Pleurochrysis_carterae.AAC.1